MVPMRLLIDECVRRTVADIFSERGHQVYFAMQELGQSTPDALVAAAADHSQLILVTCNYRHFKGLISRRPLDNQVRFRHAGLISFERCLQQTMGSIEFEYEQSQKRPDKRLIVGIFPDEFRAYY
jgi:hypothetical protein